VGYCGDRMPEPTYHHLGRHAETLEVDFDPRQISFEKLLEVFWASHDPTRPMWSTQYRSAIFCHGEEQLRAAFASRDAFAELAGARVQIEIVPIDRFWRAEDYHQKHYLKVMPRVASELRSFYPDHRAYTDSTAVARANAYCDGNRSWQRLEEELPQMGLSSVAADELRAVGRRRGVR
jgi:peptide-methionine (S)-S-oxide reductase